MVSMAFINLATSLLGINPIETFTSVYNGPIYIHISLLYALNHCNNQLLTFMIFQYEQFSTFGSYNTNHALS